MRKHAAFARCLRRAHGRDITSADRTDQNRLTERMIDARPGDVIEIPEGIFAVDRSLSLTVE